MPAPKKYPDEMRERAIRLVLDIEQEAGSITASSRASVRSWVSTATRCAAGSSRPGSTGEAARDHERGCGRIRQLERENAELRRANAILRTASAFFAAELGHH